MSSTEPPSRRCPRCGTELESGGRTGVCPRCALASALEGGAEAADGGFLALHDLPVAGATVVYVGDYELLELIAQGGMGVVYQARQRSLNRVVALKLLLGGSHASPEYKQRFRLEAQAAAQLQHPGIVPIYEVGEHGGQPYFSMEYVAGRDLAALVRNNPLPPERAARYVRRAAEAIHYAHSRGVLHRDLKPSNILIGQDDRPRITDFGLAKQTGTDSDLTLTGQTLGTPGYLPPEQASREFGAVGPASDVYALGAVLYHLLTGRPPFLAGTIAETLQQVLHSEPVSVRGLNPAVPRDLETICLCCLAKEPGRRYLSADALGEDLQRWLDGEPIRARPPSGPERVWLWCRRNPLTALLTGLLAVSMLGGGLGILWQWRRAETRREQAQTAMQAMEVTTLRQTERLFRQNRQQEGLSILASILSRDLNNPTVASRLVSALSQISLVLPAAPPIQDASGTSMAILDAADERIITVDARLRTLGVWDSAAGRPICRPIECAAEIVNVECSRTGNVMMAVILNEGVNLYDPRTGLAQQQLSIPGLAVAALSPDSVWVVAGLTNGRLVAIERLRPERRREWPGHASRITGLEFSQDSARLLSASGDQRVRVWSASREFAAVVEVPQENGSIQARLSPNGRWVLASAATNALRIWECPSGRVLADLPLSSACKTAGFSPDSARVALGLESGLVMLYALPQGQEILQYHGHSGAILDLAFSPDGLKVVSGSEDSTAQVWDAHTGKLLCVPMGHGYWVNCARFTSDGQRVLTTEFSRCARLWEVRPGTARPAVVRDPEGVVTAAFPRTGAELVTVSETGAVRLWDSASGILKKTLFQPATALSRALFDPTARWVLMVDTNQGLEWLDLETGRRRRMAPRPVEPIYAFAVRHDGGQIAFVAGARVFVCATENGEVVRECGCNGADARYGHRFYCVRFSPDGGRLLAGCNDMHARLWDLNTGAALADFPHGGPVSSVEFSPDGSKILTASSDNTACLWEGTNATAPQQVFRHRDGLLRARFSADAARVLTCSRDCTAVVWNSETGLPLVEPLEHAAWVRSGGIDPSGRRLVTVDQERVFRFWDALSGVPLTEPVALATRHRSPGHPSLAISPDWTCFASAAGGPEVPVWPNHMWPSPCPDWLPKLASAVAAAGYELSGSVRTNPPPAAYLAELRGRLSRTSVTDPWTRWGRWFLADRGTRARSWDTDEPLDVGLRAAWESGDLAALRLGIHSQPTNALALAHLAKATLGETNNPCRIVEAGFLSLRSVELAPQSEEIRRLRQGVAEAYAPPRQAR